MKQMLERYGPKVERTGREQRGLEGSCVGSPETYTGCGVDDDDDDDDND